MIHDEIWAVDAKRAEVFFIKNPGDVKIIPLEGRRLGTMTIPQTRIIISGDNADELYHRFYLSFITAGG